jgi:plastocyanin
MQRSWRLRATGLALTMAAAAFLAVPVLASTSITVTSGGCSGGGTLFCFTPESASGTTGSAVAWTNQSGVAHTVTVCTASTCPGAPANTGSDSFDLSLGSAGTVQFTFSSAGTYTYYCKIHGYAAMHGAVTVAAASTPPPTAGPTPTPSSGSSPTPRPSGVQGSTTTTPGTGAGLGAPLLLVPLGLMLILAGVSGRRKR